jgi:hypothetical protein
LFTSNYHYVYRDVKFVGSPAEASAARCSIEVVSAPGRVVGTHNGDDACHEPDVAPWHSAFGGLVRAIVNLTEHTDQRLRHIDRDVARLQLASDDAPPLRTIEVVARSAGLESGRATIGVSTDERYGVLAVAALR